MEEIFNVDDVLRHLLRYLNEQGENLEDLTKRSHENKSLIQHVTECWNIADGILKKLGISEDKIRRFCFSLCIVHDIGKLDPKWQIAGAKKIKHAERSGELLWRIKKELARLLPLPNSYLDPLIFATLKHHSSLHIGARKEEIHLERAIRSLLLTDGKLDISLAINIADTIGVFKLADIISASDNISSDLVFQQYDWSKSLDENIVNGIKHRAKEKCNFDSRKYALQNEIACSNYKHLTLVAPTGWGKTALGLLRIKRTKPNKVFYVLPTITAIRAFKKNLKNIFGSNYVGEYFYFSDVEDLTNLRGKPEELPTYPTNFHRYFVPKIMITTIDQLLLTALQFGKYHLRRFNLTRSLLILDEFHLFTPEMIGALEAIFENLASIYHFSVLLMSATPSMLYMDVLENMLRPQGIQISVLKTEYERLKRHNITYVETGLFDFIQENKDMFKEKRVLVISNTVDRAVQVYDFLQKEIKDHRVHIIHGRFAYKDRARRENEARNADILVSTQVAEVSLDISYDVLITELAPIPSLIQRFGRVNRYNNNKYIREENVYICRSESEKPYLRVELIATEEVFPELEMKLQKEGEKVYLSILNEYHDKLPRDYTQKIEKMRRWTNKVLHRSKFLYYLTEDPKIFGREPSCLAIPYCYRNKVKRLKKEMQGKNFEERRRLIACMKKYFISVPFYIINSESEWDEDLRLFVVGGNKYIYDPKRGLLRS